MDETAVNTASTQRLSKSGISRLITVLGSQAIIAAAFFLSAGTLDVPRGWLYYGGVTAYLLVATSVMLILFPSVAELVNERGQVKADAKRWDVFFGVAYTALMFVTPAVAGLDVGRFHWSAVPAWPAAPALGVTILGYALVHWAMVTNKYAETMVRIQEDRQQQVVSTGPYAIVRHPFYIALIIIQLVYPLAVGSLYAFIPGLAIVVLFVWRTAREDATLQAELAGYAEYTARTRYRLVPGVW